MNNPLSFTDLSGLRGHRAGSASNSILGGASDDLKGFFTGVYNSSRNNWNTWGGCGSVAFNFGRYSFARSGCFVDDGNVLSGMNSREVGVGAPFGLGAGAGSLLANSSKATDLSGYSVCLDVGVEVGLGGGVEVCAGLNVPLNKAVNSVADLNNAFSGIVSVFVYAAAGVGSTTAIRQVNSQVFSVWDYPKIVESVCGHVLQKPSKAFGAQIPVCSNSPGIDLPFL